MIQVQDSRVYRSLWSSGPSSELWGLECVSQKQCSKRGPDPSSKPDLGQCGEQSGKLPSVSGKETIALHSYSHTYITCSGWQEGQGHDPILQGFSKCQTDVALAFCSMGVDVLRDTQLLPEGCTGSQLSPPPRAVVLNLPNSVILYCSFMLCWASNHKISLVAIS